MPDGEGDFAVEQRGGVTVVVYANDSCRPASALEVALIDQRDRLREENKALRDRLSTLDLFDPDTDHEFGGF